ncbi:hypothetical protein [Anoxybacteroides amylolyticum]|uniref:Uncharacterized protein n=1 Tax=Anoxybacteroides amylolyticum TaxID=294699 RepID=A0A161HZ31_9BACL|nr:hypothetical protein [Anoxybacillus amylolyticus]ANB62230.1 hypothetical protein GFC30_3199 [Anoxybacillus amylolyticus]
MRKIDLMSLAKEVDREIHEVIQRELSPIYKRLNNSEQLETLLPDLMGKVMTINRVYTFKLLEKALRDIYKTDS